MAVSKPCPNTYHVRENADGTKPAELCTTVPVKKPAWQGNTGRKECNVFQQTEDDERLAPSIEDLTFLHLMAKGSYKNDENSWVALPFKHQRRRFPDYRAQGWD